MQHRTSAKPNQCNIDTSAKLHQCKTVPVKHRTSAKPYQCKIVPVQNRTSEIPYQCKTVPVQHWYQCSAQVSSLCITPLLQQLWFTLTIIPWWGHFWQGRSANEGQIPEQVPKLRHGVPRKSTTTNHLNDWRGRNLQTNFYEKIGLQSFCFDIANQVLMLQTFSCKTPSQDIASLFTILSTFVIGVRSFLTYETRV